MNEATGRHPEVVSELAQQEADDPAVRDYQVTTCRQVVEEPVDPIAKLCLGFSSWRHEAIEGDQALLCRRVEIVEAQPFDLTEVELSQSLINGWLPCHNPGSLYASL